MNKLHQLPNGDWLTLSLIRSIRCFPATEYSKPHAQICHSDMAFVKFETFEEVENFANDLAEKVNKQPE